VERVRKYLEKTKEYPALLTSAKMKVPPGTDGISALHRWATREGQRNRLNKVSEQHDAGEKLVFLPRRTVLLDWISQSPIGHRSQSPPSTILTPTSHQPRPHISRIYPAIRQYVIQQHIRDQKSHRRRLPFLRFFTAPPILDRKRTRSCIGTDEYKISGRGIQHTKIPGQSSEKFRP
jgi:hypothetical protein